MCGIVGYCGSLDATGVLLEGLKRLEYRGYDSAGIAINGSELWVDKASGKVANLAAQVQGRTAGGCGIAHTRWATHGEPTKVNAHPHCDQSGRFAIVHNGIIENYQELRSKLESEDVVFVSETDSEVIAHLLSRFFEGDLLLSLAKTVQVLRGTFGIAALTSKCPDQIACACRGSSIVIGVGEGENMVASDIAAFCGVTRQVLYLNDGELALLTANKVIVTNSENLPIHKEIVELAQEFVDLDKKGFTHYMLKEIFEQPSSIHNTMRGRLNFDDGTVLLSGLDLTSQRLSTINRIVIPACGSSLHAGLIGEYFFEDIAGIPTEVEQAAEFRYRNPIIDAHTLVLPISQSGETADTLAAVKEAQTKGAIVAAISNVVGSTLARQCQRGVYLHAGPEISVASTKGFTSQVTALMLLALLLGRNRHLNFEGGLRILKELESLPEKINCVLQQADQIAKIAHELAHYQDFFFIGRGILFPVALEGALKLKEISYVHAEGYHAAELKHGPLALLDSNVPVIALANQTLTREKMLGNIQECRARKSPVVTIATEGDEEVARISDYVIFVPEVSGYFTALIAVTALQLFAYYFANERGCAIDQPRNLAKSVTVE